MSDFWIPIANPSTFTVTAIEQTLTDCCNVRKWTLDKLKEEYQKWNEIPSNNGLKFHLSVQLLFDNTSYYTLQKVVEQAAREFRIDKKIANVPQKPITEFDILPRRVWRKYLEKHGGVSTVYGYLSLGGKWQQTLVDQAIARGITMQSLPDYWYSATIRKDGRNYWIRFNLKRK